MLVSNEDEKGAPALVVLDTFFSNDCSVLVSNEDENDAPALVVLDLSLIHI